MEKKFAVNCVLYLMAENVYGAECEIDSMLSARLGMGTLIDYDVIEAKEKE